MISWQRSLYMLGLVIVEATPIALLLMLAGTRGSWALFGGIVLAGTLADWLVRRWLTLDRQRPALLGGALLLALWAIKGQVGGGAGLLAGWGRALGALLPGSGQAGLAYVLLLTTLYAFWRGTRLLDHDSVSLRRLFARSAIALMLILGIGFLIYGGENDALVTSATVMVLAFFAVGLLSIALASAAEEHDTQLRRLGWRGLLTLCGAIGLVLVLGLLLVSLLGRETTQAVRAIGQALTLVLFLIFLPLLLLFEAALEQLMRVINLSGLLNQLQFQQQQQQQQQQQATELLQFLPPWLGIALRIFFALLPILILVALYLLVRRRARRAASRDEERESLWSWNNLAADLRDLFAGLRNPFGQAEGLRAALARLHGESPVNRIRRSYIRLLLAGEAHERPRTPPQTPREYEPAAGTVLPAARPIATLTSAYERARYHPSAVTPADATEAERAWSEIEESENVKRKT